MSLSAAERAEFIALMTHLGPEGDDGAVLAFLRDHYVECLDEIAADPGYDQVRAGLLRIVPRVIDGDGDRDELLGAAARALEAYRDQVAGGDPAVLGARHPAWVGLAALELGLQSPTLWPNGLERAIALASVGFASLRDTVSSGRGEVLWAMAEQAEEAGWTDRARVLYEAALDAPFEDAANAARVRLLLSFRCLDDGEADAAERLLVEVIDDAGADEQTRVHARWVLARLAQNRDDVEGAREHLREALREAQSEGEDDVVDRIKGALGALDED